MIFSPPGFFCHRPTHVTAGSAVILLMRFTACRDFRLFAGIVDVLKAKKKNSQLISLKFELKTTVPVECG